MADKNWDDLNKGTWSGVTAYTIGDFVDNDGASYTCVADNTNQEPPNATYWALVASKGDTGATGATGATGPTGPTGPGGDMTGPGSSTDDNIPLFDGTSGALLKDGGLGLPSSAIVGLTDTQTLTNKTITKRVTTISSHATPTIDTDACDVVTITAQAEALTSMTTNLSGTPTNFQSLIFRILDDGTARAITWGASFQAMGVALPTTTTASKVLTVGFLYDTVDSKWGCIASVEEA